MKDDSNRQVMMTITTMMMMIEDDDDDEKNILCGLEKVSSHSTIVRRSLHKSKSVSK